MGNAAATFFLVSLLAAARAVAVPGEAVAVPVGSDGVQRMEIVGGSYFFRPAHLVVKAGVPVELLARKEPGIVPHTWVLNVPGEGIHIDTDLGTEPKKVQFTIRKAGRYDFYCRNKFLFFESHREKGMAGIIEVVE
jgi:plastocyanin